jgi:hypothetical protein
MLKQNINNTKKEPDAKHFGIGIATILGIVFLIVVSLCLLVYLPYYAGKLIVPQDTFLGLNSGETRFNNWGIGLLIILVSGLSLLVLYGLLRLFIKIPQGFMWLYKHISKLGYKAEEKIKRFRNA